MKVVFHIGTKKTGSTTLQRTLRDQAPFYRSKGILYPEIGEQLQHKQLLFAISEESEMKGIFGFKTSEQVLKAREKSLDIWLDTDRQVHQGDYHTVVFSSEFAFGLRPHSLARLLERLGAYSTSIHLVGYFRSPVTLYRSSLQQSIKSSHIIRNPLIPFDYRRRFRKLANLDCASATVRCFERAQLHNGCIVQDFSTTALGLTPQEAASIPVTSANESVSAPAVKLLHDFNQVLFPGQRRPGRPITRRLLKHIQQVEQQDAFPRLELRGDLIPGIEHANRDDLLWLRDNAAITFTDVDYDELAQPPDDQLHRVNAANLRDLEDVMIVNDEEYARFRAALLGQILLELPSDSLKDLAGQTARPGISESFARKLSGSAGHRAATNGQLSKVIHFLSSDAEDKVRTDLQCEAEDQIFCHMLRFALVQLSKVTH
ncbi:hypothetical protein [Roseovarius sp.]|uniref:hypothetical protein n=1 Tax=Roseovarius sp. TaxID=1486281 RepID=UPI003BAD9F50